jgi:hypothetical protein
MDVEQLDGGRRRSLGTARPCAPGDLDSGTNLMFGDAITAHDEFGERIGQQFGELRFDPRAAERFYDGSLPGPVWPAFRKSLRPMFLCGASFLMGLTYN